MDIQHTVVHRSEKYQSAFPTVIRLQNGDLITLFYQSPVWEGTGIEGTRNEVLSHWHGSPKNWTTLIRSVDEGRTWDPDSVVAVDVASDSENVNAPVISELSSGELLLINHRWYIDPPPDHEKAFAAERHTLGFRRPADRVRKPTEKPFDLLVFDSLYTTRSNDQGHTWGVPEPFSITSSLDYCSYGGRNGVIEMPDGSLLIALEGELPGDARPDRGPRGPRDNRSRCYAARSYDGGRTWRHPSLIALDDINAQIAFGEPGMLRLPGGKLIAHMRTDAWRFNEPHPTLDAEGYVYQAFSTDDGWTWQGLHRTPIWGWPPHLLRLRSGRILCTYGHRREPFGVRAVLSDDEGETWDMDNEIVIRDDGATSDLGYPASVQLEDGQVLTVYYHNGEDGIRYIGSSIYAAEEGR